MGQAIAALVGVGLVAYLLGSFVGREGDGKERPTGAYIGIIRAVLKRLHQFAPLLIGCIWVFYGLMHMCRPDMANQQMFEQLKQWRGPLWHASGAFEIALGLAVIDPRWRVWALRGQLAMLVLLAPFVVYLLDKPDALKHLLEGLTSEPLQRVVLVTHNLLLFVWTLQLHRDEMARVKAPAPVRVRPPRTGWSWGLSPALVVAVTMLVANLAGCSVIALGPWQSGALYLWAMGCIAAGALVGFLFGVPRWVSSSADKTGNSKDRYEPNTNIEKLSDWLTQMLVGVGLVELHRIGPLVHQASQILAQGLVARDGGRTPPASEAGAFCMGLISYFLVAGVIQGFLLTRMFLASAWRSEKL